jgi:glycosyltransferase involved in cell wall biosynthesis
MPADARAHTSPATDVANAVSAAVPAVVIDTRPRMVVGVTHPQTCLILASRLSALRQAGFRVTLICSPGKLLTQTAATAGVDAYPIPIARTISPIADIFSLYRLWRALRKLRPAIVEFSTPKAGLLGSLAACLARVPHRVYCLRGLKLETASGFKRLVLLTAEKLAAFAAHQVICNSESLRTEAIKLRIANPKKMSVLGDGSSSGVDLLRFSPGTAAGIFNSQVRTELNIPAAAPVIGFVGRLTRDKGVPELITAFNQILRTIPNAYLLFVGWFDAAEDAVDRALISAIVSHPQIRTTGMVTDTAPFYKAMDLLVLPTHREGFPNVILEAAATGLPVITTLSTGARDAVIPEVTGLLIPRGYPEAIQEATLNLLHNADRRIRMGRAARAWVSEHYSIEKVLNENIEFYLGLLGANRRVIKSTPNQFEPSTSERLQSAR